MAWFKATLLALPQLAVLIARLCGDERVPLRTKLVLAGLAAYLVSPWDLIPDFIPVLGQLDDLVVLLLLVDGVLNQVDETILFEHWPGDPRVLSQMRKLARLTCWFVPERVKKFVFVTAAGIGAR